MPARSDIKKNAEPSKDRGNASNTERRNVRWLPLDQLDFDPLNPRLPDGMERVTQAKLLEALARDYDLLELGQSIADNGYFAEEPLVTVPVAKKDRLTVVEGNRRLAAMRLLTNPQAAPRAYRKRWEELSEARKVAVNEAPNLVYESRDEIIPYLGFRHITGVLPWKPYQKGRYIAQLVEQSGLSFVEIARMIGSKGPTVREHYVAYTLLRQARDAFLIDTASVEDSFGVLRRSLSDPNIRGYMGLKLDAPEGRLARPAPRAKAGAVAEVFSWMFGTDNTDPVLTDSRDIRKLGVVLANREATEALNTNRDLDQAFELTGGEERRLVEMLNRAGFFLDQALPMAIRHTKSSDVARAVGRCRQTFEEIERHFPKEPISQSAVEPRQR